MYRLCRTTTVGCVLILVALCAQGQQRAPTGPSGPTGVWPGRYLFISVDGTSLSPTTSRMLREVRPGGVVLLGHNIENEAQTKALVDQIKAAAGMGLGLADLPLIAVDQEGGSVNRLRLNSAPSAASLGRGKDPAKAENAGRRYAVECRKRGVAIVFAPVLDLYEKGASDVIGNRSFGEDPWLVSAMGLAFAKGLMAEGVLPVAKHFPGHGGTKQDSHRQLAVLQKRGTELLNTLFPFQRAVQFGIPGIMVGHIACPELNPKFPDRPASLSPLMIKNVLRLRWGYEGVVIADDINMGGVEGFPADGAVQALRAGNDAVIFVAPGVDSVRSVSDAIGVAVTEGLLFEDDLNESRRRLEAWQTWLTMSLLQVLETPSVLLEREALLASLPSQFDTERDIVSLDVSEEMVSAASHIVERASPVPSAKYDQVATSDRRTSSIQLPSTQVTSEARGVNSDPDVDGRSTIQHQVAKGETLYLLEKRYGVSIESIREWNALADANRIHIGQIITIHNSNRNADGDGKTSSSSPVQEVRREPFVETDTDLLRIEVPPRARTNVPLRVRIGSKNPFPESKKGVIALSVDGGDPRIVAISDSCSVVETGSMAAWITGKTKSQRRTRHPLVHLTDSDWRHEEWKYLECEITFRQRGTATLYMRATFQKTRVKFNGIERNIPETGPADQCNLPTTVLTIEVE